MKIEVTTGIPARQEFPCLMQSEEGRVVLFLTPTAGLCVSNSKNEKLEWSDSWAIYSFKPFEGTITIRS